MSNPDQDQGRQLGVIAEEVETVFPEIVKETDNPLCAPDTSKACDFPKVKAVDYPKLAAVAIQGLKELSERFEQLESRLLKVEQLMSTVK